MDRVMSLMRAVLPNNRKELIAVSVLTLIFCYAGYTATLPAQPSSSVKILSRSGYLYLDFGPPAGQSCKIRVPNTLVVRGPFYKRLSAAN